MFQMITARKYRHNATGVLVVRDDDKRTWCVRLSSGETALYTASGRARRWRSLQQALQHGCAIVGRLEALAL